jgi:hypothetical protein
VSCPCHQLLGAYLDRCPVKDPHISLLVLHIAPPCPAETLPSLSDSNQGRLGDVEERLQARIGVRLPVRESHLGHAGSKGFIIALERSKLNVDRLRWCRDELLQASPGSPLFAFLR